MNPWSSSPWKGEVAPLARPPADPPCQDWRHLRMSLCPSSPPALPASCEAARRAHHGAMTFLLWSNRQAASLVSGCVVVSSFHHAQENPGGAFPRKRTQHPSPPSLHSERRSRNHVVGRCGWVDGYLHQYVPSVRVIAFGGVLWREHAADSAHARVVATTSIAIVVSVLGLVDGGACDAYTCSWRCS